MACPSLIHSATQLPPAPPPLYPVCSLRAILSLSLLPSPLLVSAPYSRLLFMCSPVISRPLRILLLLLLLPSSCRQHHVLSPKPHWHLLSLPPPPPLSLPLPIFSHLPLSTLLSLSSLSLLSRLQSVRDMNGPLWEDPPSPHVLAPGPSHLRPSRSDDSVQKSALLVASPLALVPAHCHFWFGACVTFYWVTWDIPVMVTCPPLRANPEWIAPIRVPIRSGVCHTPMRANPIRFGFVRSALGFARRLSGESLPLELRPPHSPYPHDPPPPT